MQPHAYLLEGNIRMQGYGVYALAQSALQATLMFFKRECGISFGGTVQPMTLSPSLGIIKGVVEQALEVESACLRFAFRGSNEFKLIEPTALVSVMEFVLKGGLTKNDGLWYGINLEPTFFDDFNTDPSAQRGSWILEVTKDHMTFGGVALWQAD